jgi:hypothetical protein
VREKPYIDAEYVVVRGPKPRRWDPLRGLGWFQQIFAIAFMFAGLAILKWLIWAPLGRFADWLLALCGIGPAGG